MITITINSEENDDWMKSLPGYADEIAIHDELARKLKATKRVGVVKVKSLYVKRGVYGLP